MMVLGYSYGGMKVALFMLWIVIALALFWAIVIFSLLQQGIHASSKDISKIIFWGGVNIFYLRWKLPILIFLFAILSGYVWEFLGQKFPDPPKQSAIISEIPEIPKTR
ncbi:MAG: hypothetical protein LRZ85_02570 [Alphaproteobacteria bacterium]|nr:hypothetical protein [Alphaproteobacteria bacterium]